MRRRTRCRRVGPSPACALLALVALAGSVPAPAEGAERETAPQRRTGPAEPARKPSRIPERADRKEAPVQLPVRSRGEAPAQVAPVLEEVKLRSPTGLWSKTYDRTVEVVLDWAPGSAPDAMRVSEHADFRDASWEPVRQRSPFTLSGGSGDKTVFAQIRRRWEGPAGRVVFHSSRIVSGSTEYEDRLETAQGEVERLGCLWDLEARSGIVALVRCPLAELVENVEGLDGIAVSLLQASRQRVQLKVSGTVEGQDIEEAETLAPIEIADLVRVATDSLHTRSVDVSAQGDVARLRLEFESGGTEIVTALRQPGGGRCRPCVPDLEWNDATLTLNLRLDGTASSVRVDEIFVSDLGGDWDLAGELGGAAAAALQAVGISGAAGLRQRVSDAVSSQVTARLNGVLESRRGQLEEALMAPLHEALADVPGSPTVGYQPFNHSFLVELPL